MCECVCKCVGVCVSLCACACVCMCACMYVQLYVVIGILYDYLVPSRGNQCDPPSRNSLFIKDVSTFVCIAAPKLCLRRSRLAERFSVF